MNQFMVDRSKGEPLSRRLLIMIGPFFTVIVLVYLNASSLTYRVTICWSLFGEDLFLLLAVKSAVVHRISTVNSLATLLLLRTKEVTGRGSGAPHARAKCTNVLLGYLVENRRIDICLSYTGGRSRSEGHVACFLYWDEDSITTHIHPLGTLQLSGRLLRQTSRAIRQTQLLQFPDSTNA